MRPAPADRRRDRAGRVAVAGAPLGSEPASDAAWTELKSRLHGRLLDRLNLAMVEQTSRDVIRAEIEPVIRDGLADERALLPRGDVVRMVDELLDELLGYGPLQPLLADPTVSDITINGPAHVFVERSGRMEPAPIRFRDDAHLVRILNKIVAAVGRRIDESQPMVDARLPDGSRINAIVPPLALDGPLVSIRRFSADTADLGRLVALGALSRDMADLLAGYVVSRRNVLVSGGTGSGKTTLLNALAREIPEGQRVITIEDTAELQIDRPNVARLETRPANMEGRGEITPRQLVRNALRMRPDRIVIGECRGDETFDMLQAMNTGHEGSLTTLHANTPRDALSRVLNMIVMSGISIPAETLMRQIADTLDVVVHLERLEDGRRRVMSISEIAGAEDGRPLLHEVYRFNPDAAGDAGPGRGAFERGVERMSVPAPAPAEAGGGQ